MIYNYKDYDIINESLMNEEINFNELKNKVMNLTNKHKALDYLISKFNSIHNLTHKLKISKMILLIYMLTFSNPLYTNLSATQIDKASTNMTKFRTMSSYDLESYVNSLIETKKNRIIYDTKLDIYKDPLTMNISPKGKELIKEHEQLRLVAYVLRYQPKDDKGKPMKNKKGEPIIKTDGNITIGWGHGESIKKSKFKEGQKIDKTQAQLLFDKDIDDKVHGIKDMFRDWKNKGKEVKVTQSMFDAMVSLSFNIGMAGFRNTAFVQHLENGDYQKASKVIPFTNTQTSDSFPGLNDRRKFEQELFLKDLNEYYKKHQVK